jgi:hypothetical protein
MNRVDDVLENQRINLVALADCANKIIKTKVVSRTETLCLSTLSLAKVHFESAIKCHQLLLKSKSQVEGYFKSEKPLQIRSHFVAILQAVEKAQPALLDDDLKRLVGHWDALAPQLEAEKVKDPPLAPAAPEPNFEGGNEDLNFSIAENLRNMNSTFNAEANGRSSTTRDPDHGPSTSTSGVAKNDETLPTPIALQVRPGLVQETVRKITELKMNGNTLSPFGEARGNVQHQQFFPNENVDLLRLGNRADNLNVNGNQQMNMAEGDQGTENGTSANPPHLIPSLPQLPLPNPYESLSNGQPTHQSSSNGQPTQQCSSQGQPTQQFSSQQPYGQQSQEFLFQQPSGQPSQQFYSPPQQLNVNPTWAKLMDMMMQQQQQSMQIIAQMDQRDANVSRTSANDQFSSGGFDGLQAPVTALPTFDGDIIKYMDFKRTFLSIANASRMGKTAKLHMLREQLKGVALDSVARFELIDSNYDLAWSTLDELFTSKRRLVESSIESIMSFKTLKDDELKEKDCIRFLQTVTAAYESARNMGTTLEDVFVLIAILRFGPSLIFKLENFLEWSKDIPKMETLKNFLLREHAARSRAAAAIRHISETTQHDHNCVDNLFSNDVYFLTNDRRTAGGSTFSRNQHFPSRKGPDKSL